MNARMRIGEWVVVGEFHRDERVVVLKVVHKDRPGRVVALKLCLDTSEEAVAAFKREIENTLEQPLPDDMPVVLDHGEDEAGRPYFVMPFRHLRVRTFEELDDLVRNSRKRFRRLVSRVAGVWKTAIITKWTAVGAVLLGVVLIAALVLLLVRREVVYKTEHKEDLEVEKLVDSGGIEYMKGNFEAATNFFGRAMRSPHFKPENFPHCDVMNLYRDSCMWLTNDERRAFRKRAMQKRGAARR